MIVKSTYLVVVESIYLSIYIYRSGRNYANGYLRVIQPKPKFTDLNLHVNFYIFTCKILQNSDGNG